MSSNETVFNHHQSVQFIVDMYAVRPRFDGRSTQGASTGSSATRAATQKGGCRALVTLSKSQGGAYGIMHVRLQREVDAWASANQASCRHSTGRLPYGHLQRCIWAVYGRCRPKTVTSHVLRLIAWSNHEPMPR